MPPGWSFLWKRITLHCLDVTNFQTCTSLVKPEDWPYRDTFVRKQGGSWQCIERREAFTELPDPVSELPEHYHDSLSFFHETSDPAPPPDEGMDDMSLLAKRLVISVEDALITRTGTSVKVIEPAPGFAPVPAPIDNKEAPDHCPGCRQNARQTHSLHNRVVGLCKCPEVKTEFWACEGCQLNIKRSSVDRHSCKLGHCYWADKIPRTRVTPAVVDSCLKPGGSFAPAAREPTEALNIGKRPPNVPEELWAQIPKGSDGKRVKTHLVQQYQNELREAAYQCLTAYNGNKSESYVALVAEAVDRIIAEYCTGKNSRIGRLAPKNCKVIRLTEEDDMTSDSRLQKALKAVQEPDCLLWVSLPCTGGSSWQRINAKRPDARAGHKTRIR